MRRAAKVDANQADIVAALRMAGATVQPLHAVGKGCPDLLVGYQRVNYLLEVKDGSKVPSAQKLTDDQVEWHELWRGQAAVVNDLTKRFELVQRGSLSMLVAHHEATTPRGEYVVVISGASATRATGADDDAEVVDGQE